MAAREHQRQGRAPFPQAVKGGLATLTAVSIYFEANLTKRWWPDAYMSDARWQGFGSSQTPATSGELRQAARGATIRGWLLSGDNQLATPGETVGTPGDSLQVESAEWHEHQAMC